MPLLVKSRIVRPRKPSHTMPRASATTEIMSRHQLLIFDCDGILVDSEGISSRVFARLLNERGVSVTAQEILRRFAGRSLAQCCAQLPQLLGGPIPAGFVEQYRAHVAAALRAEITPIAGIEGLLDVIEARAVPYCVASNSGHATMRATLGATGLLPRFEGRLFSAADVAVGKPAPDVYLLAASRCGFEPAVCGVIEDTPTGVAAGHAAGMTVYGYAASTPADSLRAAGAHHIFNDMRQLPALLFDMTSAPVI